MSGVCVCVCVYSKKCCGFREHMPTSQSLSSFMKIRAVGAELFHAGERTDITNLIFVFRNFANDSKRSFGVPNFAN